MALILFTSSFPFGHGEQFLETEIKYLSNEFKHIIIVPTYPQSESYCRPTPSNIEIMRPVLVGDFKRIFNLRFIPYLFSLCYLRIIARNFVKSWQKKQVRLFLTALNTSYYMANEPRIRSLLKKTRKHDLLYFYWGAGAAFMLPFMSEVEAKKIFRVHGSDLYEFLYNDYFPFRSEQISACDRVFPVSNNGLLYLSKKYTLVKEKGKVFRLGVDMHPFLSNGSGNGKFHIASCSSLIKLKRVSLIVDILKQLGSEAVIWTHFGDGEQREFILNRINELPSTIKVNFMGNVENKEIYEFYKNQRVDLFINVSSSEGIPVSIMEALSYGIPVVATDVGGTAELVNELNGVLIDKDFVPAEVAIKIKEIIQGSLLFDKNMIKLEFKADFNATQNYSEFSQYIKNLSTQN